MREPWENRSTSPHQKRDVGELACVFYKVINIPRLPYHWQTTSYRAQELEAANLSASWDLALPLTSTSNFFPEDHQRLGCAPPKYDWSASAKYWAVQGSHWKPRKSRGEFFYLYNINKHLYKQLTRFEWEHIAEAASTVESPAPHNPHLQVVTEQALRKLVDVDVHKRGVLRNAWCINNDA